MNENVELILIDHKDRTNEIEKYEIFQDKVEIQFYKSEKLYNYPSKRVALYRDPTRVSIDKQKNLYAGLPLRNVEEVLKFNRLFKVFFKSQPTQIYDADLIQFELEMDQLSNQLADPMDYWNDISQYAQIEDETEAFLRKQFSKLNAIHPESVLALYLKQE
ncbi:hypothetical protein [Paenibacillus paeoniae]|uniref:Uncharacterized protein n=1 Tax=Paenibacillus paeoniae TaxID=2292705 RepID=A0A371PN88_9BACL|nr:hypothetical protein [Paenibacillus paeoniae]REK77672.1 hypothetical protein DX130_11960 [Paenibacillus paeoniae]